MPSHQHETIIDLLSESSSDLADVLRAAGLADVPSFVRMERVETDLTQALPVEYTADGVFRFFSDEADRPVLVVILEVQRQPDPDKEWSWPVYLTVTRSRERCETCLVVLATNEATAEWARRDVALDREHTWRPVVIGPGDLPEVADFEAAKARPVLAIVWALTHGQKASDAQAVRAVLDGVARSRLDRTLATYYSDVILAAVSQKVRNLVEAMMRIPENYEFQSPTFRRIASEAKAKGLAEGREEGREEGRTETIQSVRSVLMSSIVGRGFVLTAEQQSLVSNCSNIATLAQWLARVAIAQNSGDIFVATADPTHH